MVTTTFTIKPYLAKFMYVKYGCPVHLTHIHPVYHCLQQLSVPHPQNVSWKETGNVRFILPSPRYGKSPEKYNYIGKDSAFIIEKAIEVEIKMEFYEFLLENKCRNGIRFKKSMEMFVEHYQLEELIEEESLMRAFQRWRKMINDKKS